MRSKFLGSVIVLTVSLALSSAVSAQPKNRKDSAAGSSSDRSMEKQMEWEKKVMGDDSAKAADMKRIAAAQRLAEQAAKNPQPVQAPKPKDPNKEGVRAKQEAAIGLPIASDQETRPSKKSGNSKKSHPPASSSNDELGALVATSLAEGKSTGNTSSAHHTKSHAKPVKGKGHGRAAAPSTLDQMFATSN